ncbi:MAG TPA: hypothetical protein VK825_20945 [Xanthobacteraceae bacterium]|jgi:hypothetical protein|nr:hypothetical protein [Xanthobacteraceae bacterium]
MRHFFVSLAFINPWLLIRGSVAPEPAAPSQQPLAKPLDATRDTTRDRRPLALFPF